jgi:hypothetical protein
MPYFPPNNGGGGGGVTPEDLDTIFPREEARVIYVDADSTVPDQRPNSAVAFGYGIELVDGQGIAIGHDITEQGAPSISIGKNIVAGFGMSLILSDGVDFSSAGGSHLYVGNSSNSGGRAVTFGDGNTPGSGGQVTLGINNDNEGNNGVAVGQGNTLANNSVAVGYGNEAPSPASNAALFGANNVGLSGDILIGTDNTSEYAGSVLVGASNEVSSTGSGTVFGKTNSVVGFAIALGNDNNAEGSGLVVGAQNTITGSGVIFGLGNETVTSGIIFGGVNTAESNGIVVGTSSSAIESGIAIGHEVHASQGATVIGANSTASHSSSVALGSNTDTSATYQIALGERHVELQSVDSVSLPSGESGRLYVSANGNGEGVLKFANSAGVIDINGVVRRDVELVAASGYTEANVGTDSFHLVKLSSSGPARVRGYRNTSDYTSDEARPQGTPPEIQGKVLFEFVFDSSGEFWSTGFKTFLEENDTILYLNIEASTATNVTLTIEGGTI